MAVEAELKRRNPGGALVDWLVNADGTDPVADAEVRATLVAILAELGAKYEGGPIALDSPTLAALETITVANQPASPETGLAKDATLAALLTELGQKLEPGQAVALDSATLAALESVTAVVSGSVTVVDHKERHLSRAVATVTAAGSTTILTPTAGTFVRLWWLYAINDPSAEAPPLIDVSLGAEPVYRAWAISKSQRVDGPTNGALVVTLSGAGNVAVSVLYEQVPV